MCSRLSVLLLEWYATYQPHTETESPSGTQQGNKQKRKRTEPEPAFDFSVGIF